ncbi:Thiopurine S-methyltransferase [Macrophomina phaseolina MS6]|uniref:Thiopurine S-methyltransferase n=1 Tax=Macrophomina phaseolina (strain MS6) TaxID=1126212 RepID=K2RGN1_MACPH|nr:Thiopurine S-methyltransferase [Macrophomina phaseolina MS6]
MRTKQKTVCHTCRAHKLGCDGKRPSCSQCQFIGRSCGGYQLDLVVVPHEAAPRNRNPGRIISKRCLPSSSAVQNSTAAGEMIIDSSLTQLLGCAAHQCPIPRPLDSTTPKQFTTAILNYFMPENKRGCFYIDPSSIQVCGAWVDILPRLVDVARPGSLISSAVRAFGAAIIDRSSDGRYSNFKTFEAYNSAIQQLKSTLSAPKTAFSIETAAAIACLFMAEVRIRLILSFDPADIIVLQLMLPTSSVGPHAHLAGFSALIRSYPPEMFSLDPFRAIFAGCRPIIVSFSIAQSLSVRI